jgi:hypothetical protein
VTATKSDSTFFRFAGQVFGTLVAVLASIGSADDFFTFSKAERNHWAFQPVMRPQVPANLSETVSTTQNEIDAFIVAALQAHPTTLSPASDRLTLLRRLTLDLIGMPPTPAQASEFLADDSPDAYERLVDRLLANPHYGEAWGRMWLDVVRFAETSGFNADPARPLAYKYRDYVIRAFNRDLSYDRFLQEQLAGDELFPDDVEALAATGYCRMWADESNASNIHLARQLALNDLTGNLGAAVLGLSIGCAQCHDHKFDPLLQKDFYRLQAFFSGIVLEDQMPIGSHEQLSNYHRQCQQWLIETSELRHELQDVEREARIKVMGDRRMKFPGDVLAAIDCLPEERTTMQRQLAFWSERQMEIKNDDLTKHLTDEDKVRRDELIKRLAEAKQNQPKPPLDASLMAVAELSSVPPKTHLLAGGSYDKPLEEVQPHFPAILRTNETKNPPTFIPPSERSSGRRSELARWLTTKDHPLTHRVWVNRIWQGHFGRGLVENANDFGVVTPRPTHPELLDWLTSDFVANGFSTKLFHRLIVSSATYRQRGPSAPAANSSVASYSFFPRRRLSSERIRDAWLAASGTLNDTMFGPGVRPELPPNFGGAANWKVSEPPDRSRRSVYIYAKRNLPYPLMAAFDFPDMHESCGCRTTTTIAPQALMLLNSELIVNAARQMARRNQDEANSMNHVAKVGLAWQIAFGRNPTAHETEQALKFMATQQQVIADADVTRTGEDNGRIKESDADEAFVDFCHAILNANEFLFVD